MCSTVSQQYYLICNRAFAPILGVPGILRMIIIVIHCLNACQGGEWAFVCLYGPLWVCWCECVSECVTLENSLHCTHTQCGLKLKSEAGKINGSLCRRGPWVMPKHTANSACNKQQRHRVSERERDRTRQRDGELEPELAKHTSLCSRISKLNELERTRAGVEKSAKTPDSSTLKV